MHRCYLPVIAGDLVDLPPDEARHLARVLRAREGDAVVVFDGLGGEWDAVVDHIGKKDVRLRVVDARRPLPEPPVAVTLGVAVLKGDQMSVVVRDATVLGVRTIWPLVSSHVAVPSPGVRAHAADRWRRVAVGAAKQCGRAVVPDIRDLGTFEDLLADAVGGRLVMCAEPDRLPADRGASWSATRPARATVLIGPEGGWSDGEVAQGLERGAELLSLGPRTLRAELAPTVVLSVLWERWGWR